jgi:hypothetical protein
MVLAYPAAIFVIVSIDNVMTAVFKTVVATVDGKHALRVGMLRSSTDNAMNRGNRITAKLSYISNIYKQ